MSNMFSYPIDEMHTAAGNMHSEIDALLPQHQQLINLITNLEGLFPGNVDATFVGHVRSWSQNVATSYTDVQALASNLSQGSQLMTATDQHVSQGFTPR